MKPRQDLTPEPSCKTDEHPGEQSKPLSEVACLRAASIFSVLGDPNRLRLLGLLVNQELCVTEIAEALNDNLPAVSQRLKLLRSERIVNFRRKGKHVFYRLDDDHIVQLIQNCLAHADHP
jgi:DNA-binding transcriptional ArsR family regulator